MQIANKKSTSGTLHPLSSEVTFFGGISSVSDQEFRCQRNIATLKYSGDISDLTLTRALAGSAGPDDLQIGFSNGPITGK